MKNILHIIFAVQLLGFTCYLNAQSCGNSGPVVCTPSGNLANPGFESASYPCVIRTVPYNNALTFKMFDTYNYAGEQIIDSVQITGVINFPCGLCWSTNHANNTFYPGDSGCLNLAGRSSNSIGQYPVELTLTAWTNGNPTPQLVPASLVTDAGIRFWVKVLGAPGTCPVTDTATNSSKNIFANCPAGIDPVSNDIAFINLVPNPVNTNAILTFFALKAGIYQLRIADISGQVISTEKIESIPGENTTTIERNELAAGIYFIMLSTGKSVVTRKFVVSD